MLRSIFHVFAKKKQSFWEKVQNLIWPKMELRRAWRFLVLRIARLSASPHAVALGFAAGAFASFTPFVGFHFFLAVLLAFLLRASILASAIGTVVGNPVTFPLIWLAAYNIGVATLGRTTKTELLLAHPPNSEDIVSGGFLSQASLLWRSIEPVFLPLLIGGIPLGLVCAALCYWLVRMSVEQFKTRRRRVRAFAAP